MAVGYIYTYQEENSMNRLSFSLVLICVLASVTILHGQNAKLTLSSAYQMKLGDYAALILPELLKVRSDLDAPVVATYEPDLNTIAVEIFGGRNTAEGAKETIQNYVQFLQTTHIPYLARRFGLTLTDQDYSILYYDRTVPGGPKLILRYAKGQYTLPPP